MYKALSISVASLVLAVTISAQDKKSYSSMEEMQRKITLLLLERNVTDVANELATVDFVDVKSHCVTPPSFKNRKIASQAPGIKLEVGLNLFFVMTWPDVTIGITWLQNPERVAEGMLAQLHV